MFAAWTMAVSPLRPELLQRRKAKASVFGRTAAESAGKGRKRHQSLAEWQQEREGKAVSLSRSELTANPLLEPKVATGGLAGRF